jgi:hypothetical protein
MANLRERISGWFRREGAARRPVIRDPERFEPRLSDPADGGAAGSKLEKWALALSLIDRHPQAGKLRDCLKGLASPGGGRGLLVVVPGLHSHCPDYFLERCVIFHVKEHIDRAWNNLGHVDWDRSFDLSEVIERIGDCIRAPADPSVRDVDSLSRLLAKDGRCVCFYHIVEGAHWQHDPGRTALRDWGRIFTQKRLTLRDEQLLIAFLGLCSSSQHTVETALGQLVADWNDAGTSTLLMPPLVMPPLDKIIRTDVLTWRTEASRKFQLRESLELQFQSEIAALFKQDDDGQVMEEIVEKLGPPLRIKFQTGVRIVYS